MHVLTKIFIVLVSLLAVLLVPLVVVYAHNENSYKARFQAAESKAFTAQELVKQAESRAGAEQARLNSEIEALRTARTALEGDKTAAETTIRQLESQLAASKSADVEFGAKLAVIASSTEAGQQLIETLVTEQRELRANSVALERQKVELDEALRDVSSQLDVAEQARRALAEELARLKDEHTKTLTTLSSYIARHGELDVRAGMREGIIPDKTLTATVIRVERSSNQVLAEIDAGSKHGIAEGWLMTIGSGGQFIANLRIVNVDINRATGIVTLERKETGKVQVGHTAHALAGQE